MTGPRAALNELFTDLVADDARDESYSKPGHSGHDCRECGCFDVDCADCGGSGECPGCEYDDCVGCGRCAFSGRCAACGGTGERPA